MDILNSLNDQQREAVLQTEGPVLILAGAGSGKTKALTHRIAYLICEKMVSTDNILAVTFTNKAAGEMSTRVAQLLISNSKSQNTNSKQIPNINNQNSKNNWKSTISGRLPWMGTFHSICMKILRREIGLIGYKQSFSIYDESDALILIKKTMKELGIDSKEYNPNKIKNYISSAKNELIDSNSYQAITESYFQEIVAKIYELYQKKLKAANALDFDDILTHTVKIFEKFPEILAKYQNIFKYILVDEYQDTNTAQYRLVKLLAAHGRNICVVGDDYQAIYGFRGANFQNILNFEKDYPDAKIIKMEQNYRSTQTILDAADNIIKQNANRTDKTLWTKNKGGAPITVYEASNEHDEVEFILREFKVLVECNTIKGWNDLAILYRTNAQSRVIEEVILNQGLPYRLIGAYRFYERKEVKDIISYLKLIANADDQVSFERVVNCPPRGIGKKTLEGFSNKSQVLNPKISSFLDMMENFRAKTKELSLAELIEYIADRTGYKLWTKDGTEEGDARWENIEELKSVAQNTANLEEFLEKVSLASDLDNYDASKDAITLMTMHNAKGLEFPVVFIAGMEEGLFPHSMSSMDPMEMEEERRLCYVGMTRAKKRLYLTHAGTRLIYGEMKSNMRSRFIDSLPEHLVDSI